MSQTDQDSHFQRNLDVYSSEEEIASHEKHFFMQAAKFEVIHELVSQVSSKSKVADVGCLTGIGSVSYKKLEDVDEVHVFDASDKQLAVAADKGLIPHKWICGEQNAPMQDDFFDLVVASDIIEHLIDTDYFIKELKRITKPGGHLIITMPNLGWWVNRFRLMFGKVPVSFPGVSSSFCKDEMVDLNHIRINLPSEWKAFFEFHGLEVLDLKGYRLIMGMKWYLRVLDRWIKRPGLSFGGCYLMKVR